MRTLNCESKVSFLSLCSRQNAKWIRCIVGSVNNNGSTLGDWDQLPTVTCLIHSSFSTHARSLRIGERIGVVSWTCGHKR